MEELRAINEAFAERTAKLALDLRTRAIARDFVGRLDGDCEPVRALVYGSRARGDDNNDSDLDLAVILSGAPGDRWGLARKMARIAFDVLLETGVLIDPLPLWEIELSRPDRFVNPALLSAILHDGVEL